MLKNTLLLCATSISLLGLTINPVYAEEVVPKIAPQSPHAAKQIKQELMAKLAKIEFFSAKFNQQVFDSEHQLLQAGQGSLVVSKPNKVYWKTQTPEESLIVADGETLWLFDPFIEQVTAMSFAKSVANTPILLLTNQSDELWQQYTISSPAQAQYVITANNEQNQVKALTISFKGAQIIKLVIDDITGQKSEITLSDNDYTTVPAAELFNFVVPEGIYLDDQR